MKKIEPLIKWGHFIAQAPYHTACLAQEVERLQKTVNELIEQEQRRGEA